MTKIVDFYARTINLLIIILMYALMFAVTLQILGRYVWFVPRYMWAEEVARMSLIWMIFLGSMIGVRDRRHFYVDFLPQNLPAKVNAALNVLYYVLLFAVSYIFIRYGYRFFQIGTKQASDMTGLNLGWVNAAVPVAGITWAIFLIEQIVHLLRGEKIPEQHEPDEGLLS